MMDKYNKTAKHLMSFILLKRPLFNNHPCVNLSLMPLLYHIDQWLLESLCGKNESSLPLNEVLLVLFSAVTPYSKSVLTPGGFLSAQSLPQRRRDFKTIQTSLPGFSVEAPRAFNRTQWVAVQHRPEGVAYSETPPLHLCKMEKSQIKVEAGKQQNTNNII